MQTEQVCGARLFHTISPVQSSEQPCKASVAIGVQTRKVRLREANALPKDTQLVTGTCRVSKADLQGLPSRVLLHQSWILKPRQIFSQRGTS